MKDKIEKRIRRKAHIKTVMKNNTKPRLCIFKSLNNIYVQVFSFDNKVLAQVSSLNAAVKGKIKGHKGNVETAKIVGKEIAELCLQRSITEVAFDRNGYIYHGRVKALADAARESGLKF
ncbi:MAG: 50S ribosomal protein L18 [Candidatus Acidulodesulfobacterium acidiphilum]|uniref:Large ribosomal subunit protein uL18 n=1 Tax=Candidatus Acidulodesulfobacterium acidiphilum TaxID=2597224 RepID=A0A520XCQ0_9DELT|nr:MAG: 50S ribosomal protein L18 [Candidatus Acidulodesulfobacterium acidiphilum]